MFEDRNKLKDCELKQFWCCFYRWKDPIIARREGGGGGGHGGCDRCKKIALEAATVFNRYKNSYKIYALMWIMPSNGARVGVGVCARGCVYEKRWWTTYQQTNWTERVLSKVLIKSSVVVAPFPVNVGNVVYWLWEETHVLKVLGSNPSTMYGIDIYLL